MRMCDVVIYTTCVCRWSGIVSEVVVFCREVIDCLVFIHEWPEFLPVLDSVCVCVYARPCIWIWYGVPGL